VTFSVARQATLIRVTLTGAVDVADLLAITKALDQTDSKTRGLNRLVDAGGVTSGTVGQAAMLRLDEGWARCSPAEGVRTAIVAPGDEAFGFGRMCQDLLRQRITVRVFRERDEAMAWLEPKTAGAREWVPVG